MPRDIVSEGNVVLSQTWSEICSLAEQGQLHDWLDDETLIESVRSAVNSRTKSYRYVLPTQIIAKAVDSSLDSRCLQASRGGAGAFDARTIASRVVVPFDQSNYNVLGGSPEPYANNPLRIPEISQAYRSAQKNPADRDRLCHILNTVEERQDEDFTLSVLKQVLTEIYRRLSETRVVYPVPRRIAWRRCTELIEEYLRELSGGDRLLCVTSALFVVIGKRFQLYSDVRRASITAADQSTGMAADLECVSRDGTIVLAVEVTDRKLTISYVKDKIPRKREKQVSEIFFVAQQGMLDEDIDDIQYLMNHEFVSGYNIYVTDLITLCNVALALLGEQGRHEFLVEISRQLEEYRSEIQHRRAWASLLGTV